MAKPLRCIVGPMTSLPRHAVRRVCACASALLLALACLAAPAESDAPAPGAAPDRALLATYRRLAGQLERSGFGRPLLLDSAETRDGLQGDIHAVLDHPLAELRAALTGPAQWCELLSLHINNRRCRVGRAEQGAGDMLTLSVVRRYDLPVEDAFELPFSYRVASAAPEHLAVDMAAGRGPLGTSNYHVVLEAVALDERRTFVHFSYAYDHNAMVRLATQAYLAIFGSRKVGFTVVGNAPDGRPTYIAGLRGLVERNAMRYFLALDAHLAGADGPAPERTERRQAQWFESIEKYPRQLHEVDLETYLALKRADRQRDGAAR